MCIFLPTLKEMSTLSKRPGSLVGRSAVSTESNGEGGSELLGLRQKGAGSRSLRPWSGGPQLR